MNRFLTITYLLFINMSVFAHEPLIKTKDIFNINIKGIIHIGAYIGSEHPWYQSLGMQNSLWVEADPDTYKKLVDNIKPNGTTIIAENFAASNKSGFANFFRTNNNQSSSLLELKLHKNIHPEVFYTDTIKVPLNTLDQYFEKSKLDVRNYNIIVIDVQGAELLALEGAVNTLKTIDCILAEVNYSELYEGAVQIWDLDQFLLSHGFVRADTISRFKGWGDALYIKKKFFQ